MACSCFSKVLCNNQKVNSVHSIQNLGLKQIIRNGKLRRNKSLFTFEGNNWLDNVTKEICLKRKEKTLFLKRKIEEIVNQLFVLMLRLSVLILEFFVE
jgi:hypothetical protein